MGIWIIAPAEHRWWRTGGWSPQCRIRTYCSNCFLWCFQHNTEPHSCPLPSSVEFRFTFLEKVQGICLPGLRSGREGFHWYFSATYLARISILVLTILRGNEKGYLEDVWKSYILTPFGLLEQGRCCRLYLKAEHSRQMWIRVCWVGSWPQLCSALGCVPEPMCSPGISACTGWAVGPCSLGEGSSIVMWLITDLCSKGRKTSWPVVWHTQVTVKGSPILLPVFYINLQINTYLMQTGEWDECSSLLAPGWDHTHW